MIESREKEWLDLQAAARQMLDNPRLLPKEMHIRQFDQALHLWISPTFTPEKHWIFYDPQQQLNPQPKPIVQQVIWQKEQDFQRLNNPLVGLQTGFHLEPTFLIQTIEIDQEFYWKQLTKLSNINIRPFFEADMDGRDGEIFGVETLGLFYSGRITWWSSYPNEWKDMIDWYEKMWVFLEEKFDKC